jgi:hypothetical protein
MTDTICQGVPAMLTDKERDAIIAAKINEGMRLADIQTLLEKEHKIRLSYFELRLIAAGLEQVNWQKQDPAKPDPAKAPKPEEVAKATLDKAQVTVSKVIRPGAMMSGEVTFKSGNRAEWWIDTQGRPGLNPLPGSEKPSKEDVNDFIVELQQMIARSGY